MQYLSCIVLSDTTAKLNSRLSCRKQSNFKMIPMWLEALMRDQSDESLGFAAFPFQQFTHAAYGLADYPDLDAYRCPPFRNAGRDRAWLRGFDEAHASALRNPTGRSFRSHSHSLNRSAKSGAGRRVVEPVSLAVSAFLGNTGE